jgi:hypothetical protein
MTAPTAWTDTRSVLVLEYANTVVFEHDAIAFRRNHGGILGDRRGGHTESGEQHKHLAPRDAAWGRKTRRGWFGDSTKLTTARMVCHIRSPFFTLHLAE